MLLSGLILTLYAGAVMAQNNATSEIIPLLEKGYLVPKILPLFNATVGPLVITYPNGIVNYGDALNLSVVTYAPTVQFAAESAYPSAKYTWAMIDPDAPTPQNPTSAEIRHWLVADVSPSSSAVNYSSGNVLSAYKSPSPPAGSAAHRYTSVLLRQPSGQNISIYNQTSTSNFNLTLFIQQNSLTIVSANYFNASLTSTSTSSSPSGSSGSASASSASSSSSVTKSSMASHNAMVSGICLVLVTLVASLFASA